MNYNTKMNFTFESLKTSRKSVINLRKLYLEHLNSKNHKESENSKKGDIDIIIEECINEFEKALLDNLNMAKAISYVWKLAKYEIKDKRIAKAMLKLDEIMGIDLVNSEKYLKCLDTLFELFSWYNQVSKSLWRKYEIKYSRNS